MNEFEDRQLAARLGRLGGEQPDDNVAYTAVLGRVRRARRRRAAALAGGTMLGLALLATAVAINVGRPERTLRPAAPNTSGSDGSVDSSTPAGTDLPGSTVTTAPPSADSTVTTVTSTDGSDDPANTAAGGSTSPSSTPPGESPPSIPATSSPTTPPSSPPSSSASTPPPTSAATTSTFSGVGGSITVRLHNGSLSLLGNSPAAGFVAEVTRSGGQRVEVIFRSDGHETRIRVDISGGVMDPQVEENDSHSGSGDSGD